ncbi:MAG: hypothetical protein AAF799_44665 [Myxococcota bacterium]
MKTFDSPLRSFASSILGLGILVAGACDPAEASPNILLEDDEIVARSAAIDCEALRLEQLVEHPSSEEVDIGLDFAELAFDDGFADLRACEQAFYDEDEDGHWVIHSTVPGDLTYEVGLRNGDRDVEVRSVDPETGQPVGPWTPLIFPDISGESMLELYGHSEFELRARGIHGPKRFRVHLQP